MVLLRRHPFMVVINWRSITKVALSFKENFNPLILGIYLTVSFFSIFFLSGEKSFALGQEDFTITGATTSLYEPFYPASRGMVQTPAIINFDISLNFVNSTGRNLKFKNVLINNVPLPDCPKMDDYKCANYQFKLRGNNVFSEDLTKYINDNVDYKITAELQKHSPPSQASQLQSDINNRSLIYLKKNQIDNVIDDGQSHKITISLPVLFYTYNGDKPANANGIFLYLYTIPKIEFQFEDSEGVPISVYAIAKTIYQDETKHNKVPPLTHSIIDPITGNREKNKNINDISGEIYLCNAFKTNLSAYGEMHYEFDSVMFKGGTLRPATSDEITPIISVISNDQCKADTLNKPGEYKIISTATFMIKNIAKNIFSSDVPKLKLVQTIQTIPGTVRNLINKTIEVSINGRELSPTDERPLKGHSKIGPLSHQPFKIDQYTGLVSNPYNNGDQLSATVSMSAIHEISIKLIHENGQVTDQDKLDVIEGTSLVIQKIQNNYTVGMSVENVYTETTITDGDLLSALDKLDFSTDSILPGNNHATLIQLLNEYIRYPLNGRLLTKNDVTQNFYLYSQNQKNWFESQILSCEYITPMAVEFYSPQLYTCSVENMTGGGNEKVVELNISNIPFLLGLNKGYASTDPNKLFRILGLTPNHDISNIFFPASRMNRMIDEDAFTFVHNAETTRIIFRERGQPNYNFTNLDISSSRTKAHIFLLPGGFIDNDNEGDDTPKEGTACSGPGPNNPCASWGFIQGPGVLTIDSDLNTEYFGSTYPSIENYFDERNSKYMLQTNGTDYGLLPPNVYPPGQPIVIKDGYLVATFSQWQYHRDLDYAYVIIDEFRCAIYKEFDDKEPVVSASEVVPGIINAINRCDKNSEENSYCTFEPDDFKVSDYGNARLICGRDNTNPSQKGRYISAFKKSVPERYPAWLTSQTLAAVKTKMNFNPQPKGSYVDNCKNINYQDKILTAICGNNTTKSKINYGSVCIKDSTVSFINGALKCDDLNNELKNIKGDWSKNCSIIDYQNQPKNNTLMSMPVSMKKQNSVESLVDLSSNRSVITADCQKTDKSIKQSQLDLLSCGFDPIVSSLDGTLICYPSGNYTKSCHGISFDSANSELKATCESPELSVDILSTLEVNKTCQPTSQILAPNGLLGCEQYNSSLTSLDYSSDFNNWCVPRTYQDYKFTALCFNKTTQKTENSSLQISPQTCPSDPPKITSNSEAKLSCQIETQ